MNKNLLIIIILLLPLFYLNCVSEEEKLAEKKQLKKNFFKACKKGDINKIKSLLIKGININIRTDYKRNCLYYAAKFNHFKLIDYLVHKGINIKVVQAYYVDASLLDTAICLGNLNLVKYIISKKIMKIKNLKENPIFEAVGCDKLKILKYLERQGAPITPEAIEHVFGNKTILEYLFSKGIKANNKYGIKALYKAALHGHLGVIKVLLENGADINGKHNDYTPLMMAARAGKLKAVKYLVSKGADIKFQNNRGYDALVYANLSNHHDVAEYLRSVQKR